METKHTPGPWEINPRAKAMIMSESGRGIASAAVYSTNTGNGEHIEENLANAKLIAAAPEMLEALKYAKRMLKTSNAIYDEQYITEIINKATL